MRIQYVLNEAFNNIRRNPLVVVGAILAVFITLFLVFATLIAGEIARVNTLRWTDDVRVIAFLDDDADVDTLRADIESWVEVEEVFYVSKPEAYEEALELLADQQTVLETLQDAPEIIPASLRIKPVEIGEYDVIENRLQNMIGVFSVESADAAIDAMNSIRGTLQTFSLALAIALGVAAVALIANTINMAIYARREDLEIMRLVGAGNWFVRTPFLLEGVIEGLLGGAVAVAVIVGLYRLGLGSLETVEIITLEVDSEFLFTFGLLIVTFGAIVGLIGSGVSLALNRYIRS
ncbi:MAG: permease-like cell division protein FtsX [Acidimicrobiia bacterium]|nr:permease-like cell division protein FtsX [Acidimicrobiia bacterium]